MQLGRFFGGDDDQGQVAIVSDSLGPRTRPVTTANLRAPRQPGPPAQPRASADPMTPREQSDPARHPVPLGAGSPDTS